MIRKTLATLTILLFTIITFTAKADWWKYPLYCDDVDQIIETENKVYYLSNGNLLSFSPKDNESYAYNELNLLNDKEIINIYYNVEKGYLLVVYENSNIDLIYDNGNVVNLPEIKDSSVATSKNINYVAFGNDRIAIATDFGMVIYSDVRHEVIESGVYNKALRCIGIMDDKLIIYGEASNYDMMFSPLDRRHNNIDKFEKLAPFGAKSFEVADKSHIVLREEYTNKLVIRKVDFNQPGWTNITLNDTYNYDFPIQRFKDGLYTFTQNKVVAIKNGEELSTVNIPAALQGQKLTFYDSPSKVWAGDTEGIAKYDISESTPTVLFDKMIYTPHTTDKRVGFMRWSKDGKRLYISNIENSTYRMFAKGEGSTNYQTTNIIEKDIVKDVSLKNASANHHYGTKYQKEFGNTRMYGDPLYVVEDIDDPDKYYCANYFEGLYVIKLNPETGEYEEIGKYTSDNSSFTENWGVRTEFVDIDKEGNLWVGHQFGAIFSVLPAVKRTKDPSTITAADWKPHTKLEDLNYGHKDMQAVICKKSDMIFYSFSEYENGFVAIDTKGTYTNPADDNVYHWVNVTDQDGNNINYQYITFFLEDNRGCVWVGTSAGVFEITKPSEATNYSMRVRRIKVPRNDGTNYADYLLDSDKILWMALDPSDRKWIATESSGIFLVSETGDEIIYHYDKDNSPLPSNTVCSIECDKEDNTVYVGTIYGLYTFKGDASPGKEDYSDIYAYPNPVRPEYSGMVTITGLMSNSIIKITDTAGNVVFETRSEGGMATWDACDKSGDRVKSGVYYVYAIENNTNASNGAVTKILVIN